MVCTEATILFFHTEVAVIIRVVGTIFLGTGFAMLAGAVLILDLTALDANIGAGILVIAGIPMGALGLILTIASIIYDVSRRQRV